MQDGRIDRSAPEANQRNNPKHELAHHYPL
jgi:hypothetical protein